MSNETTQKRSLSVSLGAAFLMATSAIGPGFLTQTSQFTAKYLSSFAFVIVCVIIMDMIAQTNVWSIVGVSGLRGQEIANKVLPGLGYLLVVLVVLGGLAFNIGNVGGVSLGFNAMIGIPEKAGVIIGGVLAICIFLSKKANDIVGKVAQILGGIIIVVMLVVAFMAKPPVGDAVVHIFTPENPKELIPVMVTLLGGSCGGYITFSGAHKLLDAPRLSALLPATSATVSSVSRCSPPVSPPSSARPTPPSPSSRPFTPSSPRTTSGSSSVSSLSPRLLWRSSAARSAWSSWPVLSTA